MDQIERRTKEQRANKPRLLACCIPCLLNNIIHFPPLF